MARLGRRGRDARRSVDADAARFPTPEQLYRADARPSCDVDAHALGDQHDQLAHTDRRGDAAVRSRERHSGQVDCHGANPVAVGGANCAERCWLPLELADVTAQRDVERVDGRGHPERQREQDPDGNQAAAAAPPRREHERDAGDQNADCEHGDRGQVHDTCGVEEGRQAATDQEQADDEGRDRTALGRRRCGR